MATCMMDLELTSFVHILIYFVYSLYGFAVLKAQRFPRSLTASCRSAVTSAPSNVSIMFQFDLSEKSLDQ